MQGDVLFPYVGLALIYAAAATALLSGICRAAGLLATGRALMTLFVILFFVVLTQHPFPSPSALVCPVPRAQPNFMPLHFTEAWAWQWRRNDTIAGFLRGAPVLSVGMNVLLCATIGMMLWRHHVRLRAAILLGFSLSLMVELTQITGVWGIYPCAYRKFDVDDLLLNTLGVALGSMAAGTCRTLTNLGRKPAQHGER
jgi:hypothetical protein